MGRSPARHVRKARYAVEKSGSQPVREEDVRVHRLKTAALAAMVVGGLATASSSIASAHSGEGRGAIAPRASGAAVGVLRHNSAQARGQHNNCSHENGGPSADRGPRVGPHPLGQPHPDPAHGRRQLQEQPHPHPLTTPSNRGQRGASRARRPGHFHETGRGVFEELNGLLRRLGARAAGQPRSGAEGMRTAQVTAHVPASGSSDTNATWASTP